MRFFCFLLCLCLNFSENLFQKAEIYSPLMKVPPFTLMKVDSLDAGGIETTSFEGPAAAASDSMGNLWLLDNFQSSLVVFDKSGKFQKKISLTGNRLYPEPEFQSFLIEPKIRLLHSELPLIFEWTNQSLNAIKILCTGSCTFQGLHLSPKNHLSTLELETRSLFLLTPQTHGYLPEQIIETDKGELEVTGLTPDLLPVRILYDEQSFNRFQIQIRNHKQFQTLFQSKTIPGLTEVKILSVTKDTLSFAVFRGGDSKSWLAQILQISQTGKLLKVHQPGILAPPWQCDGWIHAMSNRIRVLHFHPQTGVISLLEYSLHENKNLSGGTHE